MKQKEEICPECGGELWREEVDIGVGLECGPYHCNFCGWIEYDINVDGLADDEIAF